jgi:hypothetical protein
LKLFPLSRVAVSVMNNNSNENLFCVCVDQVFAMQLLALRWIYQRLAVTMLATYCKIATGIHLLHFFAKVNVGMRCAMYVAVAHNKQTQVYMKVNGPKKSNKDEVEVLKRELASHKEEIIELKLQHKELAELTRPKLEQLESFAERSCNIIDDLGRKMVDNRRKCDLLRAWYKDIHALYDFHEALIQDLGLARLKLDANRFWDEVD